MTGQLYDGLGENDLAQRLRLPRVVTFAETTSTMDEAHALAAAGAESGTLALAVRQTLGRGRNGARWIGGDATSILCTLVERTVSPSVLDVLSLRTGLALAAALDPFSDEPVGVKWPNDLIVGGGKLAGVLIEARWRDGLAEWVAIAAGINVGAPPGDLQHVRTLRPGTKRLDVLDAIVPAMRRAGAGNSALSDSECAEWRARDRLAGRRIIAPAAGVAGGILPTGELVIDTAEGRVTVRSGSVMTEDA